VESVSGYKIDREITGLGEHLRDSRMALHLTAQQVSERADIRCSTLRAIESGDPDVSYANVTPVLSALGILDKVVDALDSLNNDIGRLRAGNLTKKRER
jgi:transcriptional regulator with XRE-family HTH domain